MGYPLSVRQHSSDWGFKRESITYGYILIYFDGNGRMPNPASDHRLAFVNLLME
jgi:hypothetical protein